MGRLYFRGLGLLGSSERRWTAARSATSPEPPDAVRIKRSVIAEDWDIFRLGLGDQHTIERVLVRPGQQPRADCVVSGNGQRLKTLPRQIARKVSKQIAGVGQLSNPEFRGDLPGRSRAYKNSIAGPRQVLPRRGGQRGIVREPPEERVRIDQKTHLVYSHRASSSSANGSKNSGPTRNLPRNAPG